MGTTNFDTIAADAVMVNGDYAVANAASGKGIAAGVAAITGTGTITHGLSAITAVVATLKDDPSTDAGAAVAVSVAVSGTTVTIKCWQDDWTAASSAANVHWIAFGTA